MAATVVRIATPTNKFSGLELVEKGHQLGRVGVHRIGKRLLRQWPQPKAAEDSQVAWLEPRRLEGLGKETPGRTAEGDERHPKGDIRFEPFIGGRHPKSIARAKQMIDLYES